MLSVELRKYRDPSTLDCNVAIYSGSASHCLTYVVGPWHCVSGQIIAANSPPKATVNSGTLLNALDLCTMLSKDHYHATLAVIFENGSWASFETGVNPVRLRRGSAWTLIPSSLDSPRISHFAKKLCSCAQSDVSSGSPQGGVYRILSEWRDLEVLRCQKLACYQV